MTKRWALHSKIRNVRLGNRSKPHALSALNCPASQSNIGNYKRPAQNLLRTYARRFGDLTDNDRDNINDIGI